MKSFILPLSSSSEATLEQVGGKALNLARLANAGLPVPDGFFISTSLYRELSKQNGLAAIIEAQLSQLDQLSPEELSSRSEKIRQHFQPTWLSAKLQKDLIAAWQALGAGPVAVRSSATAEDLPDMSFAGQQDTYLNITTQEGLLEAIINCWASLWTARAIKYRDRNGIPQDRVALSVIVQNMVQAEASGVLFTANPLTGLRSEMVIDSTFGYGEALVSGKVDPDHFIVDRESKTIVESHLGAKSLQMSAAEGGGVGEREEDRSKEQSIPNETIFQLTSLAEEIEHLYDFPQDIEWALAPPASGQPAQLFILQSRPITSLYPIPQVPNSEHLRFFFSFGAVQGILDPMTPLGRDAIRLIFAGLASLFSLKHTAQTQGTIVEAGERLWVDMTNLVRHPFGGRIIPPVFANIEPGSSQTFEDLLAEPRLGIGTGRWKFSTLRRIAGFYIPFMGRVIKMFRHPQGHAERIHQEFDVYLAEMNAKHTSARGDAPSIRQALDYFYEISNSFIFAVPVIASGAAAGLLPMALLSRFSTKLTGSPELLLEATRGLPNNITTKMDLSLWETAHQIQLDKESSAIFKKLSAADLAKQFLEAKLPAVAQQAISSFMQTFGMRGAGEIDIGRARWREDPRQIMQTLQSYLKIDDPSMAPDVVFQRGERTAEDALDLLVSEARKTFAGGIKARVIRALSKSFRNLAGLRESPKFFIIKFMGQIRQALLAAGEGLVAEGKLERADDLFFLNLEQLEEFAKNPSVDVKTKVDSARSANQREKLRRQIPRLILSDGRTFYQGMVAAEGAEDALQGSPVSPGTVEGRVRVLFDPHESQLEPGEILICPGTDPAWTPLFLAAGGLVMEVGGMMTHGAIVAREYGIPAVVGVDRATERLETGDLIRVDGSTGLIQRMSKSA